MPWNHWLRGSALFGFVLALVVAASAAAAPAQTDCPARSVPGCLCVAADRGAALKLPVGTCDCGAGCVAVDETAATARMAEAAGQAAAARVAPPPVQIGALDILVSIALAVLTAHLVGWI